ncbi:NUDIX hydrolase [Candidatus Woesearchaeota archaeon]|nr:NUDIX hydrolase [Candidatus Woesearchaeota archaeon]
MDDKTMKPLPVVVSALINEDEILLLKREKPPYKGYWCLPGGKVEFGEHLSDAAKREILEETGITCEFLELNGIYTEVMWENNEKIATFILFMTTLKPTHLNHVQSEEGELKWYKLEELEAMKDEMIENDYMAIKKFVIEKEGFYYETEMRKEGEKYFMTKFNKKN